MGGTRPSHDWTKSGALNHEPAMKAWSTGSLCRTRRAFVSTSVSRLPKAGVCVIDDRPHTLIDDSLATDVFARVHRVLHRDHSTDEDFAAGSWFNAIDFVPWWEGLGLFILELHRISRSLYYFSIDRVFPVGQWQASVPVFVRVALNACTT